MYNSIATKTPVGDLAIGIPTLPITRLNTHSKYQGAVDLFLKSGDPEKIINSVDFLLKVAKRRSVVFLISDYIDDDYWKSLKIANQKHDLIGIKVSDIVSKKVKLDPRGNEFIGLSPFSNEKTPSFTVSDEKGFYHCFIILEHGLSLIHI